MEKGGKGGFHPERSRRERSQSGFVKGKSRILLSTKENGKTKKKRKGGEHLEISSEKGRKMMRFTSIPELIQPGKGNGGF